MNKLTLILFCAVLSAACQQEKLAPQKLTVLEANNADTETCAACGMVVREQPSPRGQVIYREGARDFFCSIDDMIHLLAVPSPKGKPLAIYAEIMPNEHEANNRDTAWQPWGKVDELFFVTEIQRDAVMGKPSLTFSTRKAADKAADKFEGKVIRFEELRIANIKQ